MLSTTLIMIHKETSFNVKPIKMLSVFDGRGLPTRSTLTHGCKHSFFFFLSFTMYHGKLDIAPKHLASLYVRCAVFADSAIIRYLIGYTNPYML